MSNSDHTDLIQAYLAEVSEQFNSGHAIEHAYRPALQRLINGLGDVKTEIAAVPSMAMPVPITEPP